MNRRWLVLGLVWLSYAWFVHFWPSFHTANESIRFYFTAAMVDHGTASVDPVMERYQFGNVDRAEFGGRSYLDKAPGLSFFAVPGYWALTRLGMSTERLQVWRLWWLLTLMLVALPAALAIGWVQSIVRDWTGDERAAWAAALLVALATPWALYSSLFFGHGPAAALAVGAFRALQVGRPGLAGLAAGTMVLVDTATAPLAVMLGLHAGWRGGRLKDLVWFGLGGLPGVAAQLGYNTWVFGAPFEFAYAHKASRHLAEIHERGLYGFDVPSAEALVGLTFGAKRGLFFQAPALLLALAAIRKGAGRDGKALAAFVLVYFVWIASFGDWQAGASYGPRHLVPIVPFLGIGVGIALARAPWVGWVAAPLGVYGLILWWAAGATFPYAPETYPIPMSQLALTLLADGATSGTLLGLPALASLGIVVALVALLKPPLLRIAAGLAGLGLVGLLWVSLPEPTLKEERGLVFVECLMDHVDVAKRTCEATGGRFDEARCGCR